MSVKEIETAITRLSPEELRQLARWFDDHYAQVWEDQIAEDARAGRLDSLVEQADRDFDAGRFKPI